MQWACYFQSSNLINLSLEPVRVTSYTMRNLRLQLLTLDFFLNDIGKSIRLTGYPFLYPAQSLDGKWRALSPRRHIKVHFPPLGDTELSTLWYSHGCLHAASQWHISLVLFITGLIYQANVQGSMLMGLPWSKLQSQTLDYRNKISTALQWQISTLNSNLHVEMFSYKS